MHNRGVPLSGVSVMVVEHDADLRGLLCLWLEDAGATVREAESAIDALRSVSASCPQVLVCDLQSPGIDAWQLVELMRREPKLWIPAIALAGASSDEGLIRTFEASFDGHLVQPVTQKMLVAQIMRALHKVSDP
jgi:CheY-like chemotaxis protein